MDMDMEDEGGLNSIEVHPSESRMDSSNVLWVRCDEIVNRV